MSPYKFFSIVLLLELNFAMSPFRNLFQSGKSISELENSHQPDYHTIWITIFFQRLWWTKQVDFKYLLFSVMQFEVLDCSGKLY